MIFLRICKDWRPIPAAKKGQADARPFPVRMLSLLVVVLALLIGDRAGSLAGGLARGLALAAAAVGCAVLQSGSVQSLDVLHRNLPP